jgi:hypothetical protein
LILEFSGTDYVFPAVTAGNELIIGGLEVETALLGAGIDVIFPAAAFA